MELYKYHSLENDFLITRNQNIDPRLIPRLCHRRSGFGADGILEFLDLEPGSFEVKLYNCDGSQAVFSGNGFASLGLHVQRVCNLDSPKLISRGSLYTLRVKSGEVSLPLPGFSMELEKRYRFEHQVDGTPYHLIQVGNEHAVFFEPMASEPMQKHFDDPELYPDSINISLAQIQNPGWIKLRVIERGCDFTRACSSGALATAILAHQFHGCSFPLRITQEGGYAIVDWDAHKNRYCIRLRPRYIGKVSWENQEGCKGLIG